MYTVTAKSASQINTNFVLTNLILSMEGSFTCEDVCQEINKHALNISKKTVKKTLERLRENDYLDEIGHSYTVIPKEKSSRWG